MDHSSEPDTGPAAAENDREKRACKPCRSRKIRCDRSRPSCRVCQRCRRECTYSYGPSKPRPSSAIIDKIRNEKSELEQTLLRLKHAPPAERDALLAKVPLVDGSGAQDKRPSPGVDQVETIPSQLNSTPVKSPGAVQAGPQRQLESDRDVEVDDFNQDSSEDEPDTAPFVSIDEQGQIGIFGPTSNLHDDTKPSHINRSVAKGVESELIANAILQRQLEYNLQFSSNFDGVPTELALHLLDLHWNRQHHTLLLTYRPAFTRDLMCGGPYYSPFLLNAIFASAAKFSDRVEVRSDPSDSRTAGDRFFSRCKELLAKESPLEYSSIPTVVGLLQLGATYVARGEVSKGWMHVGLATRMVYDLGLHLDIRMPGLTPEDVEIRRRVYWGAFISDKLQSLYMGRPIAMQLRDSNVSLDFKDTMEELELWSPYVDPQSSNLQPVHRSTPVYSISAFVQFCLLAKLMTRVLNRFYFVGAKSVNAQSSLHTLDDALISWNQNLPPHLAIPAGASEFVRFERVITPNVLLIHVTYHALVILLHRPFISDGHLRSLDQPEASWKRCSTAAENITRLIGRWRDTNTLRRPPYLLGYGAYVACTIHVRNAALVTGGQSRYMLMETLNMLYDLFVSTPGIVGVIKIIKNLMRVNGVVEEPVTTFEDSSALDIDAIARMFPNSVHDQFDNVPSDMRYPMPTMSEQPDEHVSSGFENTLSGGSWNDSLTGFWIPAEADFERTSW